MSDDLVKRLHSFDCITMDGCGRKLRHEAAARIEELEADLRKMALDYLAAQGQAAEAYQAQLAAEDKLNKAIDALEKVQAFVRDLEPHADQGHTLVPALREACETLAELKGETDE
jgi:DNA repair exonuclease SbcCD ATPase subunit